jgi:hypothetical protein
VYTRVRLLSMCSTCAQAGNGPSPAPSPTIGSRIGAFQRRKPLAVSVDDQRSAGNAAALAATKALAEKPEKVRRTSVFSRPRRNKELNEQKKNSERLADEYAGYRPFPRRPGWRIRYALY